MKKAVATGAGLFNAKIRNSTLTLLTLQLVDGMREAMPRRPTSWSY